MESLCYQQLDKETMSFNEEEIKIYLEKENEYMELKNRDIKIKVKE